MHSQEQYLYFILDIEYNAVKIGITKDTGDRLKRLRSTNLHPLQLLKAVKFIGTGARRKEAQTAARRLGLEQESKTHEKFKKYQIQNEWFKYEGVLKQFIEKL